MSSKKIRHMCENLTDYYHYEGKLYRARPEFLSRRFVWEIWQGYTWLTVSVDRLLWYNIVFQGTQLVKEQADKWIRDKWQSPRK